MIQVEELTEKILNKIDELTVKKQQWTLLLEGVSISVVGEIEKKVMEDRYGEHAKFATVLVPDEDVIINSILRLAKWPGGNIEEFTKEILEARFGDLNKKFKNDLRAVGITD